ncbi:RNA-binding protein squid-like [Dorcoceras hygrometricum]|uniref:RNA-binding protein squid-like n=1 Tax=Dorcoceras hygrometricum TaxID=472368 RepID=A0A2Z7B165_9LAMI|nr:RNA-binding protein squid-like [Dorcoceras hygrometricum]
MAKTKLKKKPKHLNKIEKKKKNKKFTKTGSVDSDPNSELQTLLQPFSKEQLTNLVTDLCVSHDSLLDLIQSTADKDITHRKIFVYGLGWDATRQSVHPIFAAFGEVEDLNVVMDRTTGKCKGYAFVTFKTRKSAQKLLKSPRIQVGNRVATCHLASAGPNASSSGVVSHQLFSSDFPLRKIYVSNVPESARPEKLRRFFENFGEVEHGPTGLDPTTGKFKGYAIFVFKTVEGAKKVLEEPDKIFEGIQLHCRKATEGKGKGVGGAASITTAMQQVHPQMLEVAAAQQAQSMALFGPQMGLMNPLYGAGLFGNALIGSYYGMIGGQMQGLGLGAYGVPGVGSYSDPTGASTGVPGGAMLQGLPHMYPSQQSGQTSSSLAKSLKTDDSGYFSSLWYDQCTPPLFSSYVSMSIKFSLSLKGV